MRNKTITQRRIFSVIFNNKYVSGLFILISWINCYSLGFAKSSETPPPIVKPIRAGANQLVLKGSELCPESLMAIDTQLSPSGDVLVWCAQVPKAKSVTKKQMLNLSEYGSTK